MSKVWYKSYNERKVLGKVWLNYGHDFRTLRLGVSIGRNEFNVDIWPFYIGGEWY